MSARVSTWGSISKGGVHALARMAQEMGLTKVGEREVTSKETGEKITIPIYQKGKFLRTKDGTVYGFTYKGKIYLDPKIADSNVAIHEFTHLWAEMYRKERPEE